MSGAMADTNYERGGMDVAEQQKTFDQFMSVTVWGSLLIVVVVLGLTLVFAAGLAWPIGLGAAFAVGVVGGFFLNQGVKYYAGLTALAVVGGVAGAIATLASMAGG